MKRTEKMLKSSNIKFKTNLKEKTNQNPSVATYKKERGITLIALVVTIVVLIILATISINAVLGENGLIKQAERGAQYQANAEAKDGEALSEYDQIIANALAGVENGGGSQTPETPATVAVESVSLDKNSEILAPNGTLQLTATVTPKNATNKNVTWSSSTPSVATVSQEGLVTAVSAGSTTIRVTTEDGSKTATCTVTVESSTPLTSTVTSTNHTGTATQDTLGNPVYIPGGFKIAEDSGSTVKEGIVIEDGSGNQFVWIPVSNINGDGTNKIKVDANTEVEITLGRYTFARTKNDETGVYEDGTPSIVQKGSEWDETTSEVNQTYKIVNSYSSSYNHYELATKRSGKNEVAKVLEDFIDSVEENHGYYLARYEASYASGSSVSDYKPASIVSNANSTSSMSYSAGTLWNFISQADASTVCQNMYSGDLYVESDLCNSYAWDTAIGYIQAMGNSNYANAYDGNETLKNTGSTGDQKCKIFDMAANVAEWTTEYCTVVSPCTRRGGSCDGDSRYTAYRSSFGMGSTSYGIGFRPLLYVK